ncbi:light harvesting complex protein [Tribonema minus]|uniref:Light harvesting complex protein n=1 Tax=Tribonema minus TaxID=303371 RepID=A0A836CNK6_9STRA|nr:light harvesting complex protein [Tribonema minus]
MMSKVLALSAFAAGTASAFMQHAPLRTGVVSRSAGPVMKLGPGGEGLVGSDLELATWDPLGFTNNQNPDTIAWYRAAELKHGRVAMLAALGEIFQSYYHLPDPVFSQSAKPWDALQQVYAERPLAIAQILLAIFACEALGQAQQAKPGQAPGDLNWDPLNLKPSDPETWEKVQLRELKNGRLAMIAIAAFFVQENLTGQGPIEQIYAGHVNPFGDGQGVF